MIWEVCSNLNGSPWIYRRCVYSSESRAHLWLCWPHLVRLSGIWESIPLTTHTEHQAQLCSSLDMKKQLRWKPACFSLAFLISKSRVRCVVRNGSQQPLYLIWEQTVLFPDSVSYHQHPELPRVQGVRAASTNKNSSKGKEKQNSPAANCTWVRDGQKELLVGRERCPADYFHQMTLIVRFDRESREIETPFFWLAKLWDLERQKENHINSFCKGGLIDSEMDIYK